MQPELPPPREEQGDPRERERVLELVLLGLVVGVVAVLGLPSVVTSLREGNLDLAAVFYPLLLAALTGLAWSRRAGS
jgi:hypothetical protein